MATYKGIQGYSVQSLATDPTVADTVGQLWYNSGSGKFKISTEGAGAWSSATALNTARGGGASGGTQSACWFAGGGPGVTGADMETYDGSTWTELGNLVSGARDNLEGFGTTTAAIACGGYSNPPTSGRDSTESWNGSSWSETNNLNTIRYNFGSAIGSPSTAGLVFGGISPSHGTETINNESWNGTSWTELNNMLTARAAATGTGISTAALAISGTTTSALAGVTAIVESWNGTSWTETGDVNTARINVGTAGTTALALAFGGRQNPPVYSALTEKYDGTSWTEVADLATGRYNSGGCGSESAGICYGGDNGPTLSVTEEWNDPVYAIKTVTVS